MRPLHIILSSILSFLLIFVSCQNDSTQAKVEFVAYESFNTLKSTQTLTDIQFDSASMILENFNLNKTVWNDSIAETVEDSIEYFENLQNVSASFYGPFHINLLTGKSSPGIDMIEIDPGIYNNLEVRMGKGTGDSICFYLSGTAAIDTTRISFEVISKHGSNFILTNPSGFTIDQNKTNIVWVKINLPLLFSDVDIGSIDEDIDSIIKINEHYNRSILAIIIQNLNLYSEIGLDIDLDGEIDV